LHASCHGWKRFLSNWYGTLYADELDQIRKQLSRRRDFAVPFSKPAHPWLGETLSSRSNTISAGIIITPLTRDEPTGSRGAGYRRMIEFFAAGRAGTPDKVGTVTALLMDPDGGFITGSDFLMDGGVTAPYWFGELAPQ
jgi:hypothetical protein